MGMGRKDLIIGSLKVEGCKLCGYVRCKSALHFHHILSRSENPLVDTKRYRGIKQTRIGSIYKELNGCVLVCANCHWEIHEGLHPEYLQDPDNKVNSSKDFHGQLGLAFG